MSSPFSMKKVGPGIKRRVKQLGFMGDKNNDKYKSYFSESLSEIQKKPSKQKQKMLNSLKKRSRQLKKTRQSRTLGLRPGPGRPKKRRSSRKSKISSRKSKGRKRSSRKSKGRKRSRKSKGRKRSRKSKGRKRSSRKSKGRKRKSKKSKGKYKPTYKKMMGGVLNEMKLNKSQKDYLKRKGLSSYGRRRFSRGRKFGRMSSLSKIMGNYKPGNQMSTFQQYTGNPPGQMAAHMAGVPKNLRSNFYTSV